MIIPIRYSFMDKPSIKECRIRGRIKMDNCLFCKLVAGEIPSERIFENDEVLAFRDIRPQAPVHVLLIPKKHIPSAQDVSNDDVQLIGRLHAVIPEIAKKENLVEKGYRVVTNIGFYDQQTVPHLHYHIIGGRQLAWPPG